MKNVNALKETQELAQVISEVGEKFYESISKSARILTDSFEAGGKALICGNGGSAAEAMHFSDEMLGRYKHNRKSYPVISLTADSAALTCIGNDYGYEFVFSRQVEGLGKEGDVFIGISTSGNSKNVLNAAKTAKERGMKIIAITAPQGELRNWADASIESPSTVTARIQELHLHAIHLLSEYFEE